LSIGTSNKTNTATAQAAWINTLDQGMVADR
jgi:hypothetical protein